MLAALAFPPVLVYGTQPLKDRCSCHRHALRGRARLLPPLAMGSEASSVRSRADSS
jgi:hypothetical protein